MEVEVVSLFTSSGRICVFCAVLNNGEICLLGEYY
jgi:hypothetical protein